MELSSPKDMGQNPLIWFNEWGTVYNSRSKTRSIFTGDGASSPCTERLMTQAYNNCINDPNSWAHFKIPNNYSKSVVCRRAGADGKASVAALEDTQQQFLDETYLMELLFDINNQARYDALINFDRDQWDEADWYDNFVEFSSARQNWTDVFKLKAHYMDSNCNLIEDFDPARYRVCSHLTIDFLLSPISLIWDVNFEISDTLSFTAFALDPAQRGKWYSWRAGSKTPLLVYDPEHKGIVTSGRQLFGNWTFGGKVTASIAESGAASPREWENGYEALATLDRNEDSVLTGDELQDLALWFDDNQDGISQAGEVKALGETGVTALYTKADYRDADGNIHAHLGYERMVQGRTIRGASVDWYAKTYNTLLEAVSRWQAAGAAPASPYAAAPTDKFTQFSMITVQPENDPTGMWHWVSKDAQGKLQGQGLLQIRQVRRGDKAGIVGYSLVEQPVESKGALPDGRTVKSILRVYPLLGRQYKAEDGSWRLAFVGAAENQLLNVSGASMSAAGDELSGKSIAELEKGGKRQTKAVRYSWSAKRL